MYCIGVCKVICTFIIQIIELVKYWGLLVTLCNKYVFVLDTWNERNGTLQPPRLPDGQAHPQVVFVYAYCANPRSSGHQPASQTILSHPALGFKDTIWDDVWYDLGFFL